MRTGGLRSTLEPGAGALAGLALPLSVPSFPAGPPRADERRDKSKEECSHGVFTRPREPLPWRRAGTSIRRVDFW